MNALTVAAHELNGKRNLVLGTLALGVVLLAAPWLPWLADMAAPDRRLLLALTPSLGVALALALLTGITMTGSDLQERRAGFYFARPLSGAAIFGGKLLGGMAMALAAAFLVLLPTLLMHWRPTWAQVPAALTLLPITALLVLATMALGNAASISLRCRSPWLLLELAALTLAGLLVWGALRRMLAMGSFLTIKWLVAGILLGVPAVYLAAGFWQVSRGRTDLRANHRALATATATLLLTLGLLAQAGSLWAVRVRPSDLRKPGLAGAQGAWALITGTPRWRGDFPTSLLWNPGKGTSLNLGCLPDPLEALFAANGQRLVYWTPNLGKDNAMVLQSVDLGRGAPTIRDTGIRLRPGFHPTALSQDGRRLAVLELQGPEAGLRVYDVDAGLALVSVPMAPCTTARLVFLDPGRVRIYSKATTLLADEGDIQEVALATRRLTTTGRLPAGTGLYHMERHAGLDRLLARLATGNGGHRLILADAATGAERATLATVAPGHTAKAAFLPDGGVALVTVQQMRAQLHLLDGQGRQEWAMALDTPPSRIMVLEASGPDRLLLGFRHLAGDAPHALEVDRTTRTAKFLGVFGFFPRLPSLEGPFQGTLFTRLTRTQSGPMLSRDMPGFYRLPMDF